MAHQIGKMFYFGEVPWHHLGTPIEKRANLAQAIAAGGLDWEVATASLTLQGEPQSAVTQRVAVVRTDKRPGETGRVLGVVHPEFTLLQNREGLAMFDSLFGQGKQVYETGGYLRNGEVIWLQAALEKPIQVRPNDELKTFLLFSNSHDGSRPIDIRLTTVRVVCNNTLSMALRSTAAATFFRRGHKQSIEVLKEQAQAFFKNILADQDKQQAILVRMSQSRCDDDAFKAFLAKLLPLPAKPTAFDTNQTVAKAYETRLMNIERARAEIEQVRKHGCVQRLVQATVPPADASWWGALNSVTAWVDHVQKVEGDPFAHKMFGSGDELKTRAFKSIEEQIKTA